MGKHVEWITYKGKRILFLNANSLGEADYIAAQEELREEILKDRSSPLVMVDATKTPMTAAATKKAKEVAAANKEAGIQDGPSVVVGLTGLQRATAQLFGRGIHFCGSLEEGKEWLVKEDDKRRKG
jgi:hypothetical protein